MFHMVASLSNTKENQIIICWVSFCFNVFRLAESIKGNLRSYHLTRILRLLKQLMKRQIISKGISYSELNKRNDQNPENYSNRSSGSGTLLYKYLSIFSIFLCYSICSAIYRRCYARWLVHKICFTY